MIDASIFPTHIAAHTQATVYAIAEKVRHTRTFLRVDLYQFLADGRDDKKRYVALIDIPFTTYFLLHVNDDGRNQPTLRAQPQGYAAFEGLERFDEGLNKSDRQ